jgi:hypothetical protein
MAARAAMLDEELAIADTISAERQVNTDSVRRTMF